MKRTPLLALIASSPLCLLAMCAIGPAFADAPKERDPYDVCRNRGLSLRGFHRCVSAVYIEEARKADRTVDLENALRVAGAGAPDSSQQCRQQALCMFNTASGRHEECVLLSATEGCLQFAEPCTP